MNSTSKWIAFFIVFKLLTGYEVLNANEPPAAASSAGSTPAVVVAAPISNITADASTTAVGNATTAPKAANSATATPSKVVGQKLISKKSMKVDSAPKKSPSVQKAKKASVKAQKKTVQSSSGAYNGRTPVDMPAGHWAYDEVMNLIDGGLIKVGSDGKFNGTKPISRYETANLFARMLRKTQEELHNVKTPAELEEVKHRIQLLLETMEEYKIEQNDLKENQKIDNENLEKVLKNEIAQEERLLSLEKTKESVKIFGDVRMRYQNARLDANGAKSTSYAFADRLRLGGTIPVDDTFKANFRLLLTQPVRRTDYGKNPFSTDNNSQSDMVLDLLNVEKKKVLGGDWTLGRQYLKHGVGAVLLDFVDGVKYTAELFKNLGFTGMVLAGNDKASPGRTHGMDAGLISLDYKPSDNSQINMYEVINNAENDKFGVVSTNGVAGTPPTPATREGWLGVDALGKINSNWEYFGSGVVYRNELNGANTPSSLNYLRGDIENSSYMLGLKFKEENKYTAGVSWGRQENNFHAFDVLSDIYYLDIPYHPFEDTLQALALMGNGVFPPAGSTNPGSPLRTPAMGYRGDTGAYQADFHGYQDVQINYQYFFTQKLSFKLIADFLDPVDSKYDYKKISALTSRLRYKYDDKTSFELRAVRVTSDYNRDVTDIRSEVYMKF
ncbi:MAG: S-layer homology domain-containing protein [Candidatus Riflebacteria bacterium]|nr:S-layer homology domain-containing protein [Candidatus Riflebacteria bacterium]